MLFGIVDGTLISVDPHLFLFLKEGGEQIVNKGTIPLYLELELANLQKKAKSYT